MGFLTHRVSLICIIFIILCTFFAVFTFAKGQTPFQSFHGHTVRERRVPTPDGAVLSLIELMGNENGPVIVLQPGLIETAATLDQMADYYHTNGYKVIISQARTAGTKQYRSELSKTGRNGLKEVLMTDALTAWRYVYKEISKGQSFDVAGHSMGGMQIIAMLANPTTAKEANSYIHSAALLTAPHNFDNLPDFLVKLAKNMIHVFNYLQSKGVVLFDFHHNYFAKSHAIKESGLIGKALTRSAERPLAYVMSKFMEEILTTSRFTTTREIRRLVRQEISILPTELSMDFADLAIKGGFPVEIDLANITTNLFILSAEHDQLVKLATNAEMYGGVVNAKNLIWRTIQNTHHVDPVISDELSAYFLPVIARYMKNPELFSAQEKKVATILTNKKLSKVECEQALKTSVVP